MRVEKEIRQSSTRLTDPELLDDAETSSLRAVLFISVLTDHSRMPSRRKIAKHAVTATLMTDDRSDVQIGTRVATVRITRPRGVRTPSSRDRLLCHSFASPFRVFAHH